VPEPGLQKWKRLAQELKRETHVLWIACRHPRTPWYAKAIAIGVVAYALSPIDLIPDPIPVLGYLDDLILIPLGVILVRRLIPSDVLEECRRQADERSPAYGVGRWIAGAIIVAIWVVVITVLVRVLLRWLEHGSA
jgi:uncharacterized membrane protein YkvA (DUF1232 family)